MIMTDQDHDGSHIKGLIMNYFHTFYPSLMKLPGFLIEFITPVIKVSHPPAYLQFMLILLSAALISMQLTLLFHAPATSVTWARLAVITVDAMQSYWMCTLDQSWYRGLKL